MKVALVTPYSWTSPGGVNVHVDALAGHLRARGHEVRIIAPSDDDARSPGVISVGGTVGVPFNGSVARLAFGPRVAMRVRVALRRARPDVVHIHEPFSPSVSLLALQAAKVPVVATFHAAMESRLYRASRLPLKPLWRKIDAAIAVSNSARETVERVFGPGPVIVPNGVDCAMYADVPPPDPDDRTVVYFGRFERRKGPQILAKSAAEVLRRVPGSRIVFAGDGPLLREVQETVRSLDGVEFLGRFSDESRPAIIGRATIVCLPALGGESFGYTLVEAMAAGRPVVASDIPGFADVAGDAAELVPAGDDQALTEALVSLLNDRERIRRLAIAARRRATRFDWPVIAEQIERIYRDVARTS